MYFFVCGQAYGNQLTGSIPVALIQLTLLENLFLESNQLTGSIPPEIGSFMHLELLYLDNNQVCIDVLNL